MWFLKFPSGEGSQHAQLQSQAKGNVPAQAASWWETDLPDKAQVQADALAPAALGCCWCAHPAARSPSHSVPAAVATAVWAFAVCQDGSVLEGVKFPQLSVPAYHLGAAGRAVSHQCCVSSTAAGFTSARHSSVGGGGGVGLSCRWPRATAGSRLPSDFSLTSFVFRLFVLTTTWMLKFVVLLSGTVTALREWEMFTGLLVTAAVSTPLSLCLPRWRLAQLIGD